MKCPTCKRTVGPESRGPFCSERCRMVDLGKWLNEEYRIPDQPDTKGGGVDGIPDPDAERS